MMWRALAMAVFFAGSASAQAPRSAIDWLSESLLQPPNFVITPPGRSGHTEDVSITAVPLDKVSRDAVGLLPPERTGFAGALWGDLTSDEIVALLDGMAHSELPEVAALFKRVLMAQSDPPVDSGNHSRLLLARIDHLFNMGALDEAESLILLAGASDAEIFRRWFEIALIDQRTNAPCAALKERPALSDDVATRVICLARAGDWNAAAITASLGETLGNISEKDADLLVRFLDPVMFADLPDPGIPEPLDPITFTLREALALPRPAEPLPLPYLNIDRDLRTPARQRIQAAERLVQASAIPPTLLFAAYRGTRAASSGGAWGRAEFVQALDAALVREDDAALADAVSAAIRGFAEARLLYAFADEYGAALAEYQPGEETGKIAPQVRRILLLAGQPLENWQGLGGADHDYVQFASQLAKGAVITGISPYNTALADAIHMAFSNLTPPRADLPLQLEKIDAGNYGEVLLRAINLLSPGREADPRDIHEGLYLLRKLGLNTPARRIATQLLLIEPHST